MYVDMKLWTLQPMQSVVTFVHLKAQMSILSFSTCDAKALGHQRRVKLFFFSKVHTVHGLTLCSCPHWLPELPSHCTWWPWWRWRRPGWLSARRAASLHGWCAPLPPASRTPPYLGLRTGRPPGIKHHSFVWQRNNADDIQLAEHCVRKLPGSISHKRPRNVAECVSLPCSGPCRSLDYLPLLSLFVLTSLKTAKPYLTLMNVANVKLLFTSYRKLLRSINRPGET